MKSSDTAVSTGGGLILSRYDYALPVERIAQSPAARRDHSKLMVLNRRTGRILHRQFYQIEKYFSPGDLLVVNDSRVMPSRLFGHKPTGGKVEILLLSEDSPGRWKGLVHNVGWDEGCQIVIANSAAASPSRCPGVNTASRGETIWTATIHPGGHSGVRAIEFNHPDVADLIDNAGHMPLPPYIKRNATELLPGALSTQQPRLDRLRYQTTYADKSGSAAAPTAGLHFTPDLLDRLRDLGVQVVPITLHVGYGTFQVIESADISAHKLHSEYYRISRMAARAINEGRARGGKIFAVGTTTVRTLEHACDDDGIILAGSGWNDLYIHGNYRFKAVDHLLTNFHLPKSSLLVLASTFAGHDRLMRAYRQAIESEYRFFSYGDAMLIL